MEVEEEFYDAQGTPEYQREQRAKMAREGDEDDEGEGYSGLVMGAGENNYLLRGKHFDVLRNVSCVRCVDAVCVQEAAVRAC